MTFDPGLLHGGKVEHDCNLERGLGYFLELLMCLAPYCKHPLEATLRGVTNSPDDASPELLRNSGLNIIKTFFRVEENIELKLSKRGCRPLGGGQVTFRCRVANQTFRPLQITDQVRNTSTSHHT